MPNKEALPAWILGSIVDVKANNVGANNVRAIHELPLRDNRKCRRQMLLPKIVGRFKMNTAKRINAIRNTPGVPVWQRNYYEHVIRNEADYGQIAEYIADNPRRWEEDTLHPDAG